MSPWISRKDLDFLHSTIERLTDHKVRVERVESGMSELPPMPRKILPNEPPEVTEWINSHDGTAIRERLRREATQAAKKAGAWDGVVGEIAKQTRAQEEAL